MKKNTGFIFFRASVAVLLLVHGLVRLWNWRTEIPGLGAFLEDEGMVFGKLLAWAITALEIVGAVLIAFGKYIKWIAPLFIIYLFAGIIMVHRFNGWFVVGPSQNGMEYNVLLVICLSFIWFATTGPSKGEGRAQ